jgi:8-oxo-dGTP pyrophosphatase MutT (NUDIX family)
MDMLKDYSYGIIPLMEKDGKRYTILTHLSSWNHRGMPKWHGEKWETSIESAIRELQEETGLIITKKQIDNKPYIEHYTCFSKRHGQEVAKEVTYYTACIPYTDITKLAWYSESDGEILGKRILTLDDALSLVTYDESRRLLQEIKDHLSIS